MFTSIVTLDPGRPECTLTSYSHEPFEELNIPVRRAMIVCQGGAYQGLCEREGEPVALQYFAAGMNVFVLHYSIADKAAGGAPIIEAATAIRHVREKAAEYHVDPAFVFISGFSAGGHLSACASSFWKQPLVLDALGLTSGEICRPTGAVLCYPFITDEAYRHVGSVLDICQGLSDGANSMLLDYPADKYVDGETSPAFIWHTRDDVIVPIQNTLTYASALAGAGVPFEYHVYPTGVHGLALADPETSAGFPALEIPEVSAWIRDAIRWCRDFKA